MADEEFLDVYPFLGIPPDATEDQIKKSWYEFVHSQKPENQRTSNEQHYFTVMQNAYTKVYDPEEKKAYDLERDAHLRRAQREAHLRDLDVEVRKIIAKSKGLPEEGKGDTEVPVVSYEVAPLPATGTEIPEEQGEEDEGIFRSLRGRIEKASRPLLRRGPSEAELAGRTERERQREHEAQLAETALRIREGDQVVALKTLDDQEAARVAETESRDHLNKLTEEFKMQRKEIAQQKEEREQREEKKEQNKEKLKSEISSGEAGLSTLIRHPVLGVKAKIKDESKASMPEGHWLIELAKSGNSALGDILPEDTQSKKPDAGENARVLAGVGVGENKG